jgi:large subunit ribosomal protein L30
MVLRVSLSSATRSCRASTSRVLPQQPTRTLTTATHSSPASSTPPPTSDTPKTHYRITLKRSAVGLPTEFKATLEALGIHRRMQTVYHLHNAATAGKILKLKELVEVQNVTAAEVKTKEEMTRDRRAVRGYTILGKVDPLASV